MNVNITGPLILGEFSFFGLCDFTITQTTLTSLLVLAAVTILCWRLGRNLRKRPGRMQAVTERAVLAVYKLVDDTMGKHNERFAPYIGALFCSSVLGSLASLTGFLRSIPRDYEEAAMIDGCGPFRILTSIIIPMCKPGIVTVCMISAMAAWNEYPVALVMVTDPTKATLPVGLANLYEIQRYATDWGALFAALVLALIPTVILFIVGQKQLVQGLSVGGVKG